MSALIDITGQRFGSLVAEYKLEPRPDGRTRWLCRCDCGNTCVVTSDYLRSGRQKSCGCGRMRDLTGQRFGSLVALERSERYVTRKDGRKKYLWKCVCDCGETVYRLPEKLDAEGNCLCKKCQDKKAVAAMLENAGFVDGTQVSRIRDMKPTAACKSGVRGVFFNSRSRKWRAMLRFRRKNIYLGEYADFNQAVEARKEAEEKYFQSFLEEYDRENRADAK